MNLVRSQQRYQLHGRWIADRGLMLWIRDLSGGPAPGGVASLDPETFPEPLRSLLQRVPVFRYMLPFTVVGEEGQPHSRSVPCMVISANAASTFLLECVEHAYSGGDGCSLTGEDPFWPAGLGDDLCYLAHIAAGVDRWVRAGRVMPRLFRQGPQWYATWRLLGGGAQRVWLTELLHVMPPELAHNGGFASIEDFTEAMTEALCRRYLETIPDRPLHDFVESSITGAPFAAGSVAFAENLRQWQEGLADTDTELVLRLHEPEVENPEWWLLEVSARVLGRAPEPLRPDVIDAASFTTAQRLWGRALEAYPRLMEARSAQHGEDLLLTSQEAVEFVTRGVPAVRAEGIVVMLPRSWVQASVSVRMSVSDVDPETAAPRSVAGGPRVGKDAIVDYQWQVALGDVVLSPSELWEIVNEQSGLIQLRDSWVQADPLTLRRAAEFIATQNGGRTCSSQRGSALRLQDLAAKKRAAAGQALQNFIASQAPVPVEEMTGPSSLTELCRHAASISAIDTTGLVKATLRPYQQSGVEWIATLDELGVGGILADDMGLGKTLQVLTVLSYDVARAAVPEDTAVLVVCPMSLVANWAAETARFTPQLRVSLHHGPTRAHGEDFSQLVKRSDVIITTYNLLLQDKEDLSGINWWRVVFDEAQHIKNAATRQARAARELNATHRLALSGTPMENNVEELRSIMDAVNPGFLGTQHAFRHHYAIPIERDHDERIAAQLRTVTSPFILRRVKTDPQVIADLPEKHEMVVHASLTPEQAGLYQAVVDEMTTQLQAARGRKRKGAVLAALTRLKQVCNHPAHYLGDHSPVMRRGQHRSGKVALIEKLVENIVADGEKVLIFTQYQAFGAYLTEFLLQRFGQEVPFLHGSLNRVQRAELVEKFQEPDGPQIMVLSLHAGGTGLNLTAANHVIHCDRWWNPAVENQATDRAYRIGQRKDVQVRKLVCNGTVEERIDQLIADKSTMADMVVSAGETWITEMSDEELADFVRLEVIGCVD